MLCHALYGQTLHVLYLLPNHLISLLQASKTAQHRGNNSRKAGRRTQNPVYHVYSGRKPTISMCLAGCAFRRPLLPLLFSLSFCVKISDLPTKKMQRSLHSAPRAAPFSPCAKKTLSQRAFRPARAVRCKASKSTNTSVEQLLLDRRQLLHSAAGLALALQAAQLSPAKAAGLTLEDVTPTPAAAGRMDMLVAMARA